MYSMYMRSFFRKIIQPFANAYVCLYYALTVAPYIWFYRVCDRCRFAQPVHLCRMIWFYTGCFLVRNSLINLIVNSVDPDQMASQCDNSNISWMCPSNVMCMFIQLSTFSLYLSSNIPDQRHTYVYTVEPALASCHLHSAATCFKQPV
jgi:hypothetical protein